MDLNLYKFYKNRVAFNFLAKDADNGKEVVEVTNSYKKVIKVFKRI